MVWDSKEEIAPMCACPPRVGVCVCVCEFNTASKGAVAYRAKDEGSMKMGKDDLCVNECVCLERAIYLSVRRICDGESH